MTVGAYEVRPEAVRSVNREVANLVQQAASVVNELASTVLADTSFATIGSPVAGANKAMQARQLETLRQTMSLLQEINQLVKSSSDQYQGADEAVAAGFGSNSDTTQVAQTQTNGPSLDNVQLGTEWGGSRSIFEQFVTPHMQDQGLATGSEKRNYDTVRGAGMSDHYIRSTNSYAVDYPTFNGEASARSLATAMGNPNWQPNSYDSFTTTVDGQQYRVQILWGDRIDHGDHVHVGIRRQ